MADDELSKDQITKWEAAAQDGRLGDAILSYVEKHDWVTFVELQRRLSPFFDMEGEHALVVGDNPNVILWTAMSERFKDAVLDLLTRRVVHTHGASMLSYIADGGMLKLPLAKANRQYKKLHWLPVCLRVVPYVPKKKSGAKARAK